MHGNTETVFAFLACSDFIHVSRGVQDLVEFISDLQIFTYFVLCINWLKISEIIRVGEFKPPSSLNDLKLGGETYSSLLIFFINLTVLFFTFSFTRTCRKYFLCFFLPRALLFSRSSSKRFRLEFPGGNSGLPLHVCIFSNLDDIILLILEEYWDHIL